MKFEFEICVGTFGQSKTFSNSKFQDGGRGGCPKCISKMPTSTCDRNFDRELRNQQLILDTDVKSCFPDEMFALNDMHRSAHLRMKNGRKCPTTVTALFHHFSTLHASTTWHSISFTHKRKWQCHLKVLNFAVILI